MGWRPNREVRGYAAAALLLFVALETLLALSVYFWPSFEQHSTALKPIFGRIPVLLDQFSLIESAGVHAYVVGQHFFKGCNTLGVAAAVLLAMSAVAGEAQRGTLELWLARPVPRWRLYTERYLLGQAALWGPVLLSSATTNLLLGMVDDRMDLSMMLVCAVHQSLFLGVIYSVTFLLSALGDQPLRIAFVMLFFGIFQFSIYMVKTVTDYSLFRLADIQTYVTMMRYGLEPGATTVLVLLNVLPFLAGLAVFKRRLP
jgi:ABC-type transport system involved in multi-copper enzyme maturation permease subunit